MNLRHLRKVYEIASTLCFDLPNLARVLELDEAKQAELYRALSFLVDACFALIMKRERDKHEMQEF